MSTVIKWIWVLENWKGNVCRLIFLLLLLLLMCDSVAVVVNLYLWRHTYRLTATTKLHINNNNNSKKNINLHTFPIQFSRTQLRRQITLKGFHIVCHHVGQIYPPVEASSEEDQYYIRSAWHVVSLLVRLTWAQMYPPIQASCGRTGSPELRCTPQVETSGGQDQNWVRSSWPELRCTPSRGIW